MPFEKWVRDTFTNHDLLFPGEVVCNVCSFWFQQKSVELQLIMGKDKPQKMQNYSHFLVFGGWIPVSKGDKRRMAEIILSQPFPEMSAVAVSGQKHLAFRARRNPPGQGAGWVQFEEQAVWVDQSALRSLLALIEELYIVFAKTEIETGAYRPHRIIKFGMERWQEIEEQIKAFRKTALFGLALFLAQKENKNENEQERVSDPAENHLAGDTRGLQEPLPDDDLGAVRERDQERSIHEQPGKVHQPDLFAVGGEPGA